MADHYDYRTSSLKFFFKNQLWHLFALGGLILISWFLIKTHLSEGTFLGIKDSSWFWIAITIVVLHQMIVWIVFRSQLCWGSFTKYFGASDIKVWASIFLPFLFARPILVMILAIADPGTLPLPFELRITIGILLMMPALYTLWSVLRYFGVVRALGADHFRSKYRRMPLIQKGAFRLTKNAMYTFQFLGLYSIALFLDSYAALILAIFQHTYIWVHYFCTEKPDMNIIYG